jgi:hypothetical protein
MKRKHLTETPMCHQERLVIISYTTGLSFALKGIGLLAAIIIIILYLLVLYLIAWPNTPENLFASIYSESLIKTAYQHLLLLVDAIIIIFSRINVAIVDARIFCEVNEEDTRLSWPRLDC